MKVNKWEIVNIDDKEHDSGLSLGGGEFKLSPQEMFVKEVLEWYEVTETVVDPITGEEKLVTKKADPETLIKQIIKDADSVVTQNNKWDILPDYAARAKLKLELLRAAGIVKWKQPEVKLNFFSILFGKQ